MFRVVNISWGSLSNHMEYSRSQLNQKAAKGGCGAAGLRDCEFAEMDRQHRSLADTDTYSDTGTEPDTDTDAVAAADADTDARAACRHQIQLNSIQEAFMQFAYI